VRDTEDKGLANKEQHHEGIKYPAHGKLYHDRSNHEDPNPVRYSFIVVARFAAIRRQFSTERQLVLAAATPPYFVWSTFCFPASFARFPVCE
jgi:hypothetical protein